MSRQAASASAANSSVESGRDAVHDERSETAGPGTSPLPTASVRARPVGGPISTGGVGGDFAMPSPRRRTRPAPKPPVRPEATPPGAGYGHGSAARSDGSGSHTSKAARGTTSG